MQSTASVLTQINSPKDIKALDAGDLARLAEEVRQVIVSTVARNGGHLASNLGVVELTIALHRVFNSPADKIIWDVGHQCYAHKLITGRFEAFSTLRKASGLAGFPKRSESPHDPFNTGHASTSISAALGMLAGEKMLGGKGQVVAVIGDGALTGGLAYEALSHAGHLELPLIVILNDNKMSISANVGGLSKYLSRLTMKSKYQAFRRHFDGTVERVPVFGDPFLKLIRRLKRAVKAVFYKDNFFVDLGFDYVGPISGHHTKTLVSVLEDVQKLDRPVVVHVVTQKGKGYNFAENDPGSYHGVNSFCVAGGIGRAGGAAADFTGAFGGALLSLAARDRRVVGITAAMDKGTGLSGLRNVFPERFFDVGIAEGHALVFACGLAASGLKPVVAIYSTFIQRSVDQVIHDAALQKLPVVVALDRAGFVGEDGETHQGLFDIALFRPVPNTTILAPACETEMRLMLDFALSRETGPVIIRYPKARCPAEAQAGGSFSAPLEEGRGVWLARGGRRQVCLAFTGSLYREALEAAGLLWQYGIEADLYNLRFLKPVDEDYLEDLIASYDLFAVAEEGIREGGFGEYAAALASRRGASGKVAALAVENDFAEKERSLGTREQLLAANGLDGAGIAGQIAALYIKTSHVSFAAAAVGAEG